MALRDAVEEYYMLAGLYRSLEDVPNWSRVHMAGQLRDLALRIWRAYGTTMLAPQWQRNYAYWDKRSK